MTSSCHTERVSSRAEALAIFAKTSASDLSHALAAHWPDIDYRSLKSAETGLVMLRGRIGGDGAPFNLGEATVSKAVIELPDGTRGYGQCLGRDAVKAHLAAIFDALWQVSPDRVELHVLAPARKAVEAKRQTEAGQTAATKVDFFTLVRGED